MASTTIKVIDAVKKYGNNIIIPKLNLLVKPGEFFTLLGPSGCGKTTLLRMIAGFNTIEGGEFYFSDTKINDLDPAKRNIGMVFQNYAIFPHLSVRKNVEFGLRNKKLPKEEIEERANHFLKLMQIDHLADRMPDKLSGGQQQRVALARALCIKPDVLLMDEPLSNLDAKLRVEMRTAIKRIQQEVGITCVYVTHDQEEAMAVSDRVAVMNFGEIQQVTTPKNIYQRPANLFVSDFIGRSNHFEAKVEEDNGKMVLKFLDYEVELENVRDDYKQSMDVIVAARPEELVMNTEGRGLKAKVFDYVFLGLNTHYYLILENGVEVEAIEESKIEDMYSKGAEVYIEFNTAKINIFDSTGNNNIINGVVCDNRK